MRILHVTPSYAPCIGGYERRVQAVSERLVARGHDVTVLTLDCATQRNFASGTGAGLSPRELLNGVKIIRVNPSGGRLLRLDRWWLGRPGGWRTTNWLLGKEHEFLLAQPSGFGMILPLLRLEADIAATVNWCFGAMFWSCLALRLRRIRQVGVPVLHIDRPWARNQVYSRMFSSSHAAIVATDSEAEFARARGARSITVAGGGVDPSQFEQRDGAAIRARYRLGDRPVVGFFSRQDHLKGVPILLEAMRRSGSTLPGPCCSSLVQRPIGTTPSPECWPRSRRPRRKTCGSSMISRTGMGP